MVLKKSICHFFVLMSLMISMINAQSGLVESDISFTTYDGETNSLYDLLNSGKYVCVGGYAYGG